MAQLSGGALQMVLQGQPVAYPVYLQLIDLKMVVPKNNTAGKRYRTIVNDSIHTATLMIATQMQEVIESNPEGYVKGAILKFSEIIANDVNGRRVMIALHFEIVGHQEAIIGNPTSLEHAPGQPAAAPAALGAAVPKPGHMHDQNVPPVNGDPGPSTNMAYPGGMKPQEPQQPNQGNYPPQAGGYQFNQPPPGAGPAPGGPQYGAAPGMGGGGPPGGYGAPRAGPASGGFGAGPAAGGGPGPGYGGNTWGGGAPGRPAAPGSFLGRGAPGGGGAPAAQYNLAGSGPTVRNDAPARIVPIRSLNPYSGRWTIKARCTSKADLKRFNNVKGEGKLFSFDLLDKDGGEIRATAFNDQAEKFYDLVQVGGIYQVSKASLQQKRAQFNNTAHDFEIRLDRESIVEACPEDQDTQAIPQVQFNFQPIAALETIAVNAFVDVLGVVEQVHEWQTITRKTGEETRKRTIVIRDDSGKSIEVTFWGNFVDDPGAQLEQLHKSGQRPILGLKAVRIGEFNGRHLGTINNSVCVIEPPVEAVRKLRTWYTQFGADAPVVSLSGAGGGMGKTDRRCTLQAIRDENVGREGKAEWVTVGATISHVSNNERGLMYPACPANVNGRKCQKKMTQDIEGVDSYNCPLCGPAVPMWRYMLSLSIVDHTRTEWITSFSETSEVLFGGMTADEFRRREHMEEGFKEQMKESLLFHNLVCKLKVSEDTYNDEQRVKLNLMKLEIASPVKEGYFLLDQIAKLEAGVPVMMARDPGGQAQQQGAGRGGYGAGPMGGAPSTAPYGGSAAPGYRAPYGGGNQQSPGGAYGGPSGFGGGGMRQGVGASAASTMPYGGGPSMSGPPGGGGGGGGGGYYGGQVQGGPMQGGGFVGGGGPGGGGYGGPPAGGYGGPPPQQQQPMGGGYGQPMPGGYGGGPGGFGGGGYGGQQGQGQQGQGQNLGQPLW